MPCRAYLEDGILRLDFTGRVTRREFAELVVATEALEDGVAVTPHRIAHLSTSDDSEHRFPEIFNLAMRRKEKKFPNAFKSAIVAAAPADFGIAQMFQKLNDHPQITIRIFPDLAAAKAWIAEP